MKIINKENDICAVVIDDSDKFARADSRLVTLINKVKRAVDDVESLYFYETVYNKGEHEILSFDASLKDEVATAIKKAGYAVKEGNE